MPTVPTYGGQQVAPNSLAGGNFSAPQQVNAAPQQAQQLGDAAMRGGQSLANVAMDIQQQANQVRVDAALNQVRQNVLDLTFDQNSGYKTLTGNAALTRPNNEMLVDEYGGKLGTAISYIGAGLGNDAQRQAFQTQANNLMTQFRGGVEQHTLEEYKKFSLSTQDGTIKLGADEAKRNWNNPDMIKSSIDSVRAAVVRSGSLQGWSANQTTARMNETVSTVHANVIDAALQENNPEYALGYMNRYKDQMTADDLLRVRGVINKDVNQRVADGIATNVVMSARARSQPSDLTRMIDITASSESGGRERGADGALITSSKGAQGKMQVMPGTNLDPGYGVAAAKDSSDAERTRVGRDYLQAMVKEYGGDAQKAWAAYNWGPGNVDAAIKKHGANWLAHAPDETQAYVSKNMAALGGDGTAPVTSRPTLQDIHDNVRADVAAKYGATPPAGLLKQALAGATQQFEDMQKAVKADEEEKVTMAMRALGQNGGRFSQLPYSIRSQIPPNKLDDVLNYGTRVAKGEDITNPAVYQRLSDPMVLKNLSDNQFFQLRGELSEPDFKHFSSQRAAAQGKSADKIESINMTAMNSALRDRFQSLGIDPTPKDGSEDASRIGAIKQFVTNTMIQHQKTTGKQMTDAEVVNHIDGLFAKSVSFRSSFLGVDTGRTSQRLLASKVSDIPDATAAALRTDFKAAGIDKPTDADLLGAYFALKQIPMKPLPRPTTPQSKSGKIKPAATTVANPFGANNG